MYAGDIQDGTGLHNLVLGMVTFAIARSRSHPSFSTNVILRADAAVTVLFAGSEEWSKGELALFAEARLKAASSIVDCIRLEPDALDVSGGVYCDLCVVNALSDWMCDQTWSGSLIQAHTFRNGVFESSNRVSLFPDVIAYGRQGISTTFLPSSKTFPKINFDTGRLQESFAKLGEQHVGMRLTLVDTR